MWPEVAFQGLPARICWLGQGERARFGVALNDLVAKGELKVPVVIGRDHLDTGSVASPFRETEAMKDGSDAITETRRGVRAGGRDGEGAGDRAADAGGAKRWAPPPESVHRRLAGTGCN